MDGITRNPDPITINWADTATLDNEIDRITKDLISSCHEFDESLMTRLSEDRTPIISTPPFSLLSTQSLVSQRERNMKSYRDSDEGTSDISSFHNNGIVGPVIKRRIQNKQDNKRYNLSPDIEASAALISLVGDSDIDLDALDDLINIDSPSDILSNDKTRATNHGPFVVRRNKKEDIIDNHVENEEMLQEVAIQTVPSIIYHETTQTNDIPSYDKTTEIGDNIIFYFNAVECARSRINQKLIEERSLAIKNEILEELNKDPTIKDEAKKIYATYFIRELIEKEEGTLCEKLFGKEMEELKKQIIDIRTEREMLERQTLDDIAKIEADKKMEEEIKRHEKELAGIIKKTEHNKVKRAEMEAVIRQFNEEYDFTEKNKKLDEELKKLEDRLNFLKINTFIPEMFEKSTQISEDEEDKKKNIVKNNELLNSNYLKIESPTSVLTSLIQNNDSKIQNIKSFGARTKENTEDEKNIYNDDSYNKNFKYKTSYFELTSSSRHQGISNIESNKASEMKLNPNNINYPNSPSTPMKFIQVDDENNITIKSVLPLDLSATPDMHINRTPNSLRTPSIKPISLKNTNTPNNNSTNINNKAIINHDTNNNNNNNNNKVKSNVNISMGRGSSVRQRKNGIDSGTSSTNLGQRSEKQKNTRIKINLLTGEVNPTAVTSVTNIPQRPITQPTIGGTKSAVNKNVTSVNVTNTDNGIHDNFNHFNLGYMSDRKKQGIKQDSILEKSRNIDSTSGANMTGTQNSSRTSYGNNNGNKSSHIPSRYSQQLSAFDSNQQIKQHFEREQLEQQKFVNSECLTIPISQTSEKASKYIYNLFLLWDKNETSFGYRNKFIEKLRTIFDNIAKNKSYTTDGMRTAINLLSKEIREGNEFNRKTQVEMDLIKRRESLKLKMASMITDPTKRPNTDEYIACTQQLKKMTERLEGYLSRYKKNYCYDLTYRGWSYMSIINVDKEAIL